jgi:hypothetical protein
MRAAVACAVAADADAAPALMAPSASPASALAAAAAAPPPPLTPASGAAGGSVDHAEKSLIAAREQVNAAHAERDALSESLRLLQREVGALRRMAEADEVQRLALVARVEASDERVVTAEQRREAFQTLAEAQATEIERVGEMLMVARTQAGSAARLHGAIEAGAAAQAERHELIRRGEAATREELSRAAVEVSELRLDNERARKLLLTQGELLAHQSERLEAQAELARLQLGLSPQPSQMGDDDDAADASSSARQPLRLLDASGGPSSARSGAAGLPPRLIRLRLGAESDPHAVMRTPSTPPATATAGKKPRGILHNSSVRPTSPEEIIRHGTGAVGGLLVKDGGRHDDGSHSARLRAALAAADAAVKEEDKEDDTAGLWTDASGARRPIGSGMGKMEPTGAG